MRNNDLSVIMKTAWAVKREDGVTMSTALRLAWKSYRLKSQMRDDVVRFAFRKLDGTVREAVGTLLPSIVPSYKRRTDRAHTPNFSTQAYYDMDRQSFRCYKVSCLLLS